VLIDLREGDVLSHVKRLPHGLFICDVNADELQKKPKRRWARHLRGSGIQKNELPPEEMPLLLRLAEGHERPSRRDLFALALAMSLGATLVTGDAELRKAAQFERCPVHGTLWLLDEMVAHRVLDGPTAAAALQRMVTAGRRIPKALVPRYQEAWERGQPFRAK